MTIIDVTPEHEKIFFQCLEDWSDEILEAADHKECWYAKMKDRGLRVKLALNDDGVVGGMIQYVPSEVAPVDGKDLYYILCIWVHGHKKGRGFFQKKGMGKALLAAAESDVKNLGAKGLAAWGVILPFFMRARWFIKNGFKVADKKGIMRLLWKPFTEDAVAPGFMKPKPLPDPVPGKVNVTVFLNGWCPAQNMVYERIKRVYINFRDKIEFNVFHTVDPNIMHYWGLSDAFFVDGREIWTGPPPSYEKLHRIIEKRIKKLK
jgi:N-acetylglutamate synthase-like GNAT family acetyltransferase